MMIFISVNQLLEKDILIFVNTVAEIVHSSVQHWGGQCNKNLGNAFVVVWRIGDEDTLLSQTTRGQVTGNEQQGRERGQTGLSRRARQSFTDAHTTPASDLDSIEDINRTQTVRKKRVGQALDLMRVPGLDELADRALIAYLKVIAEINRNKQLLQYRTEPRLTAGDTQQFKVRMGFGLHVGWAIEGAVGSLYKVDATYLSPHVNMASRLETSSRQYGVPLLLSQVRISITYPSFL
jgi:class 3 adenylate cyclase